MCQELNEDLGRENLESVNLIKQSKPIARPAPRFLASLVLATLFVHVPAPWPRIFDERQLAKGTLEHAAVQ